MIFGRRKNRPSSPVTPDEEVDETLDDIEESDEDLDDADDEAVDDSDDADEPDEADEDDDEDSDEEDEDSDDDEDPWLAYDASEDWRDDGPFDISEVELEDDPIQRLDLGSLIVTPAEGMQVQITAEQGSEHGIALVIQLGESLIQVTAWAAPTSPGYAVEIRDEIAEETVASGGESEPAKGPFGTELQRRVPVQDDEGRDGIMPVRDWYLQGPRWLLNGRIFGRAAIDPEHVEAHEFEEFFHNLIVRRGDEAMIPGSVLPLTLPQG